MPVFLNEIGIGNLGGKVLGCVGLSLAGYLTFFDHAH